MARKTLFSILLACLVLPLTSVLSGCSDSDSELWGEMPKKIVDFVTQYFPNTQVDSYAESSSTYHVRLKDGPGMTFDKNMDWIAVNGYGMPLPQVLLFDQLPPALYNYLDETDNLDAVFSIERSKTTYTVVLLDSTLTYNIDTEEITGSDAVGGR